jgi:WD40 repeat protein
VPLLEKARTTGTLELLQLRGFLSACFSPDGARLLTTDQKSEIRVYSASQWDCPLGLIPHPHRHFQHLTPIKVSNEGKRAIVMRMGQVCPKYREGQTWSTCNPRSLLALTQCINPLALSAPFFPFLQFYFVELSQCLISYFFSCFSPALIS